MTLLKDVKVGTEVIFQFGAQEMRGHVLGHENTLILIGWKDGVAERRGYSAWNIKEVIAKNLGHKPQAPVSDKYTDAWWVTDCIECEIITPSNQNDLGFLVACIAAGAGLSQISRVEKTKALKQASV